jgi:hypothetical protein
MTDAVVQVPPIPGTTGQPNQQIDTSAITRSDGTVVERQRVVIADPVNAGYLSGVTVFGEQLVAANFKDRDETVVQLKRIARLLEILTDTEISAEDVADA